MKRNKKILLLLLIISLISVAGYGVYSYYSSLGAFSSNNYISLKVFDPEVGLVSNQKVFIGNSDEVNMNCVKNENYIDSANYSISNEGIRTDNNVHLTCSASLTITNNGNSDILVEVDSGSLDLYAYYGLHLDSNFNSSWLSKTLSPGETSELVVSSNVYVTSDYSSSEAVNSYYAIYNEETYSKGYIYTSFKLTATQVHN